MLFYFIPFVAGCVVLLLATFFRPRLIYEYPYFMAAVFTAFILPQAYALYVNEWGGVFLEATLLVCSACLAGCWLGYQPRAHPCLIEKLNMPVNSARFLHGGIALVAIGWFFTYKFGTLSEDDVTSMMTGIGAIYLFFGGLVFPGFGICLYCALKDRSIIAWIATGAAAIIPIQAAVFYGRREPTALFLLSVGLTLYFLRGRQPSRWLVLGVIIAAMFAIPATSQYRQMAEENPIEALKQIDFTEQLKAYFDEDAISEVKNATILVAATQETGDYQWGAGYWNRIVFRFIPAQLLGEGFKNSLMIGGTLHDPGEFVEEALGYKPPSGSTMTGLGDSFNQFGYFGCLVFAAMAYLFKNLWAAANQPHGTVAQILYIQMTTTGMRALTHQTLDFLPGLIYSGVFIGAIALYARERQPQPRPTRLARSGHDRNPRVSSPGA